MANLIELNEKNFDQEVLMAIQPVVVDFWAEWCPPCKALTPVMEKLATEYAGRAKVCKVDTETNRDLALRYHIDNIPAVLLFKGGELVQKLVGLRRDVQYRAAIDELLAG